MKKNDECFGNGGESCSVMENAGFCVEKSLESSGGDVFLARDLGPEGKAKNLVVVKRFHGPKGACFEAAEPFLWEDHHYIARILDVISVKADTVIVSEYVCGGDLYHHFQEIGVFPEFLARILMHDLFTGVSLLHQAGICHRDLKPENCVLDTNGVLKIIDFGIAARFEDKTMFNEFCGSLEYVAPEVLFRHPYHGPGVDVWACGVVLFEMVVGEVPFLIAEQSETGCSDGIFDFPEKLAAEAELSVECVKLLKQILVVEPEQRLTVPAAFDSHWMVTEHVLSVDDVECIKDRAPHSVLVKRIQGVLRRQVAHDILEQEMKV